MNKVIYKCADCGSYEIIEGSEEDCEETYKDDQNPLVSPYYACGEPKNHNHKQCPLNRDYYCDDRCKWYYPKKEACGFIWNYAKIGEVLKDD